MLCALINPFCEAATDFGLRLPDRVLMRVIVDPEGSEAPAEGMWVASKANEIEMPAANFCKRTPARLLVKFSGEN